VYIPNDCDIEQKLCNAIENSLLALHSYAACFLDFTINEVSCIHEDIYTFLMLLAPVTLCIP
jgi:hypothetical protein